jgi:hypothetical protein
MLFIERALDLLKQDGYLALSLSNSFLRSDSGRIIRGHIAANASVDEIVELDDPRTYADAATQIVLLRLRREKRRSCGRYVVVKGRGDLRRKLEDVATGRPHPDISIRDLPPDATASSRWKLAASDDTRWLDPYLLPHSSVVILTPRTELPDMHCLLGILNSRVFARYISITMPKISAGRYSLHLSRLRWFPVPDLACERDRETCRRISTLVQKRVTMSERQAPPKELVAGIEDQVACLYGFDGQGQACR